MITNFFIPELNNHDVHELWFQQDGATCHTARATINLLKDTFGNRLISRFGPVNWLPRSCDLTPLDYFLCGYVKSLVYADKPQTHDPLEDNIRRVIADIRPQMLEKVIENWTSRLDYIRASRGSPMPEIIFKIRMDELEGKSGLYCHRIINPAVMVFRVLSKKEHFASTSKNRAHGYTHDEINACLMIAAFLCFICYPIGIIASTDREYLEGHSQYLSCIDWILGIQYSNVFVMP
ncbi:putative LOC100569746 [Trichonephila clavipes]|nr:putative LOC100569746 [Trichonephila clavipes]